MEGAYDFRLSMILTLSCGSGVDVGIWKAVVVDMVGAVTGAVIGAVLVTFRIIMFSNCRAQAAQNSETEACHPSINLLTRITVFPRRPPASFFAGDFPVKADAVYTVNH